MCVVAAVIKLSVERKLRSSQISARALCTLALLLTQKSNLERNKIIEITRQTRRSVEQNCVCYIRIGEQGTAVVHGTSVCCVCAARGQPIPRRICISLSNLFYFGADWMRHTE